ncbi:MAG: enolase C-terminal domain-like protein [Actinomycetota bacterium]
MSAPEVMVGSFPAPFRIVFRHTSAARAATENVMVRLTDADGTVGWGEGTPRSYVTGETAASATRFLAATAQRLVAEVDDVDALREWIERERATIDEAPAAFCALETAALDLFARRRRCSVEALLGRPELAGAATYSAVLGDSGPLTFGAQMLRYRIGGLRHYKIKLSGERGRDRAKFRWFRGPFGRVVASSVRVDTNNLWRRADEASDHLQAMGRPLLGIEEPLTADDLDGFAAIVSAVGSPVILDESLLRPGQIDRLPGEGGDWILNCRVSKSGGVLRSIDLIEQAVDAGLGVIVGAHVGESSLLTRAALTVAAAAGDALVAQEGAFGTRLLLHDVCEHPLMFGRRGRLGAAERSVIGPHGWGIDVADHRVEPVEPQT